jgi:peroxiredoxin
MVTSRLLLAVALALTASACATRRTVATKGGAPLTLTAADGTSTTLDELRRDRDATVLVFWSAGCPCVRRYQDRVDALLDRYSAERVRVVGISSNAAETFEDALQVAKERGVRIPILRDEGGRLAEAVGAHSTPAVAVIDRAGAVRYLGWVDNERLPGVDGREPWLDRALEGVLDGNTAFAARSPMYGCPITRSLFHPETSSCCSAQ